MAKAAAARLPRFGVDRGQYGTLIVGRRFMADLTQADVKAVHKTTEALAKKLGLPLVFVSPGPAETEDDDEAGEFFYAGLLIASAKDSAEPVKVDKALLDPAKADTIPDDFWEALEEKYELTADEADEDEDDEDEDDEDEDEGPSVGVFLAPAGWAVASLYLGNTEGDPLATTSSEDTTVGQYLSEELIAQIRASDEPLLLEGAYC